MLEITSTSHVRDCKLLDLDLIFRLKSLYERDVWKVPWGDPTIFTKSTKQAANVTKPEIGSETFVNILPRSKFN